MSHMVIYRGADGKPGYQQAEDIHDAVTFVEQMRNGEGVEHARIFRLEEVTFEYRPYYRVELSGGGSATVGDPALANGATVQAGANGNGNGNGNGTGNGTGNGVANGSANGGSSASGQPAAVPSSTASQLVVNGAEAAEDLGAPLDEPFEVVESTTINVDAEDDSVVGNGARRGLFGR